MHDYRDRQEAAQILAEALKAYKDNPNVIIFGLPRGGVPIAAGISQTLHVPMDILIVRKLGHPMFPECAMGALSMDGQILWNSDANTLMNERERQAIISSEKQEMQRRIALYRHNRPLPDIKKKTVILVDDGIATGATVKAALQSLKHHKPKSVILAVPVAPASMRQELAGLCQQYICPLEPEIFEAVGLWYQNFDQVSDEEVIELLQNVH